ncbi:MAG: hypothetical protein KJO32_04910 [Deltaproteobacteria bacterium]|nr:hypothetical protein [Deltaproteobacteria bacterium]
MSAYSDDAVPDPGNVDEFGVPDELDPGNKDPGDPDPGNVDPGDPEPGAGDESDISYEKPSYQNAAQAQHAANLQEAVLAKDPELTESAGKLADAKEEQTDTGLELRAAYKVRDDADQALNTALEERAVAKEAYDDLLDIIGPGPDYTDREQMALDKAKAALDASRWDVVNAQKAYDEAEQDYGLKEVAYDDARQAFTDAEASYAKNLAERTGVTEQQIHAMRQEMGWGAMYRELGVHPGFNGLKRGHYKNGKLKAPELNPLDVADHEPLNLHEGIPPDQELMEATKRNTRTGWSDKHGLKLNNNKSSKKGLGLTQTSGLAVSEERGNKGSNKGNSSNSSKAGKSNNGRSSVGGPADKDDNGKGRGNSNKSSRGNSGNKGKNGNNGNKGGNGKNK